MYRLSVLIACLLLALGTAEARRGGGRRHSSAVGQAESRLSADDQLRFDALYMEACAQQQCGRPDQALMLMRRALELDTLSAPALFFLSSSYHAMGRDAYAYAMAHRAALADSTCYWYGEAEAQLLMELHQRDMAQACYERLARRFPTKTDPLYALVDVYLRSTGDSSRDSAAVRQCVAAIARLEEMEGINERFTMQKFYLLQQLGLSDSAFAEYDRLIRRYPYNVQYRIQKGDMQMQFGQIREAAQTYDEAARIEPDNAYVWVALAGYMNITGDHAAADSLTRAALVNANLDADTKVKVLTEFLKQQLRGSDSTEVGDLFATCQELHPLEPSFYDLHAQFLSQTGRDSLAAQQMRYAIDLRPASEEYWTRYLAYSAQAGASDLTLQRCRECLGRLPDQPFAYTIMAYVYGMREQHDSLIWAYREALQRTPANETQNISRYYGAMGDAFHQLGMQDSTYHCYDVALRYNDQNYMVLNNYAYFLSLEQRDLYKAEQMALRVVQRYPDNPTYLDTYAWILFQQQSYFMAAFYQQKAIDAAEAAGDRQATLYDHQGDIMAKQNDLKAAVGQWQKALDCDDCDDAEAIRHKISVASEALRLMQ